MTRQRVNVRTPGAALIGRALTLVLGLALVWYGLMVVLLAVKVSPHTVNSLSAYHTLYNHAAGLRHRDFTAVVRLIGALAGLLVLLAFLYLLLRQVPVPRLTRHPMVLPESGRGRIVVEPRAVERIAETAAGRHARVAAANGRLSDDELTVNVGVSTAERLAPTLSEVKREVLDALSRHGLPGVPVHIIATAYTPRTGRELS